MLPNISKKIEIAANIAILAVACLLAIVLVKSYLLTGPQKASELDAIEKELVKPPAVSLLDIDWKANGQTVFVGDFDQLSLLHGERTFLPKARRRSTQNTFNSDFLSVGYRQSRVS